MHLDEKSLDSLTVARMTDHNVRGSDEGPAAEIQSMRRDVGAQERYWRIGLGALLVIAALALPLAGVVRILLGILGVAGLVTGYSRYSAVNQMPRIDHFNDKIDQTEPKRDSSKAA